MTDQQLISKLQELKQITPRKEWVFSVKMGILDAPLAGRKTNFAARVQNGFSNVFGMLYNQQKKLAFVVAAFLFVLVGGVGFLTYGLPGGLGTKVASQDFAANLAAETTLKANVKDFKTKAENLAQLMQSKVPNTSSDVAVKEVKSAAKVLAETIQKNPKLARSIALDVNNSKTYLDIPAGNEGEDLKEALNTPYKALVEQLIKDEKKMSLTHDQQMVLDNVISLHEKGNDSDALVNLVLLIHDTDGQPSETK